MRAGLDQQRTQAIGQRGHRFRRRRERIPAQPRVIADVEREPPRARLARAVELLAGGGLRQPLELGERARVELERVGARFVDRAQTRPRGARQRAHAPVAEHAHQLLRGGRRPARRGERHEQVGHGPATSLYGFSPLRLFAFSQSMNGFRWRSSTSAWPADISRETV